MYRICFKTLRLIDNLMTRISKLINNINDILLLIKSFLDFFLNLILSNEEQNEHLFYNL